MDCAKCGSHETQRFAVAYRAGTQQLHTYSQSAPFFSWAAITGIGGVITHTDGTMSSLLAERTAPPEKRPMGAVACLLALAAALVAFGLRFGHSEMTAVGAVMFLVGVVPAWQSHRYNVCQWPQLYEHWQHQWICLSCGNTFYVP